MQNTPATDTVDERLAAIFRETFGRPDLQVQADTSSDDVPGWDSIRMVSLLLAIERDFGVKLRSGEVRRIRSVGDIIQAIRAHHA